MDGYTRERCFIGIICQKLKAKGIRHSPAARVVFGGHKEPVNAWRSLRNPSAKRRKPRGLSLAEAYDLAELVGEPLLSLLVETDHAVKAGWTLEKDDPSSWCQEDDESQGKKNI